MARKNGTIYRHSLTLDFPDACSVAMVRAQPRPSSLVLDETSLYWAVSDCAIRSVKRD